MEAKLFPIEKREMGAKLANFRKKLALAIGEKKITQSEFGEMYGGYNVREMNSYETGAVGAPGLLFFLLWKAGHSIDNIFGEGQVSDIGVETARALYAKASIVQMKSLDDNARLRLIQEAKTHGTKDNDGTTKESSQRTFGKGKASNGKARPIKKR